MKCMIDKDKIVTFVIGLLVGAVITALCFLICEKVSKNNNHIPKQEKMQMMERPAGEMPKDMLDGTQNNENRPETPSNKQPFKDNKTK